MCKSSKALRIVKIAVLCFVLFCLLFVNVFAVYESGSSSTPRYVSPIRFDFEILGSTAELTPSISYAAGSTLTYDSYESASTDGTSVISSINRTNFSVSTFPTTAIDISYRLSFDVTESSDNFTMIITAPVGFYDFSKYIIPQLSIPTGYSCNAAISYNIRITQDQLFDNPDLSYNVSYTQDLTGGSDLSLFRNYIVSGGLDRVLTGGVIISGYKATLTFTKDQDVTLDFGDPGYYLFNSVMEAPYFSNLWDLSDLDADYLSVMDYYNGAFFKFNLHFVIDGVAYSTIVNQFIFYGSGYDTNEFNYGSTDWDTDFGALAYSFYDGEWTDLIVRASDVGVDPDLADEDGYVTIPIDYIRVLEYIGTQNFSENINWYRFDLGNYGLLSGDLKIAIFNEVISWFEDNTLLYSENPLTTVETSVGSNTYSFTDGDGGMYFRYNGDRALSTEVSSDISNLYNYGYSKGYQSGDGGFGGDYGTWLVNAVGGFMNLELFPNFKIGGILSIIVAIPLVVWFLKLFAGG